MYKSLINYKTGQLLMENSTGFVYQISVGGIQGVYIRKKFKDIYLSALDIRNYYKIWNIDDDKYEKFLVSFKTYFLDENFL